MPGFFNPLPTTINSREGFKFNDCMHMIYYRGLLNLEVNSTQQIGVKIFTYHCALWE